MKVKLVEIYNCVQVMNKILDAELPASVAFKLTKLLKSINDEIKTVEDQRVKMVSKYGERGGCDGDDARGGTGRCGGGLVIEAP